MSADPKGYYRMLGVDPAASEKLITAAYRLLAQELHPDRNSSSSATADFQNLQEAYRELGDPQRRRAYDDIGRHSGKSESGPSTEKRSSNGKTAGSEEGSAKSTWEPRACDRCGAISAMPRFREYQRVFSYLLGCSRTNERGVYCSRCDMKSALRSTGFTLVLGWWSLPGFFYTLAALGHNLTEDFRHRQENLTLLAHQAGYFASTGKMQLARAVAAQALDLVAAMSDSAEVTRRKNLGYADQIEHIREFARQIIASSAGSLGDVRLTTERPILNKRVGYQAAMLMPLILGALFVTRESVLENRRLEEVRATAEAARLERAGFEAAESRKVAEAQVAALAAMEKSLPRTGLIRYLQRCAACYQDGQLPVLKVTASASTNYLIKLVDYSSDAPALVAFVRAGEEAEFPVPLGTYRVRIATGAKWYGEVVRFGPDTGYSQVDQAISFSIDGDTLSGHQLTLVPIRNGNLHEQKISSTQF